MITIPQLKPPTIKNMEVDFGTTIATSLWQRISQQLNWIEKNMPIGMVMWFFNDVNYANGSPIPDPKSTNWQFCDGSLITNPNSPMVGQNVPDFRGLYMKASQFFPIGQLGGTVSHNLSHDHGGFTSYGSDLLPAVPGNYTSDVGSNEPQGNLHRHSMGSDLGLIYVDPPHVDLQAYMRIA